MLKIFLSFCLSIIPVIFLLVYNKKLLKEVFIDIRLGRILHYFIVFLFGYTLLFHTKNLLPIFDETVILEFILFLFALSYAAVFAIVTNNIEDVEIDRISNPNRPLIKQTIDPKTYQRIAWVCLIISLLISGLLSLTYLLAVIGLSLFYYIYSCKPFRLKRIVFLAKFLIGLNTFIAALCGFCVAGGKINEFPIFWLIFILVPVSLMANFIDLKDIEGDREAGIKTLPVRVGLHKTKIYIAFFSILAYAMVFGYFSFWFIRVLIACTSLLHFYLLFRNPFSEKPLFVFHNSLFLALISLLILQFYL